MKLQPSPGSYLRLLSFAAAAPCLACGDATTAEPASDSSTAAIEDCSEFDCNDPKPCGQPCRCCCSCSDSERCSITSDGREAVERCPSGTCFESFPCADADICVESVFGVSCVLDIADCSTLLQAYERIVEGYSPCDSAGDCTIVAGHCSIGLGECWYARSPTDVTHYAARVEAIVARWHALDCASEGEACECPSDPVATCIEDASPGPRCGL